MTTTETKQPFDDCMKVFASLDNKKISKMIMTKYEFNLIISQRTVQLSQGFCPFVKIDTNIKSNMDLRKIALEELKQSKIPFIIKITKSISYVISKIIIINKFCKKMSHIYFIIIFIHTSSNS